VDFSGAERPGESVWITEAELSDGELTVESCRSARTAFDARDREAVLGGVVDRVDGVDVAGFDFPFGLPRAVIEELDGPDEWRATVPWVGEAFADADAFAEECKRGARRATGGDRTYLRRATDDPVGAKSPYHFFTHKQAYHGITDVLAPLLDRAAEVAPMTTERTTTGDGPVVLETYPAGTLRRLDLPDENYKDTTDDARRARESILRGLETEESSGDGVTETAGAVDDGRATPRVVVDGTDRERALSDDGGDALDSLIAAAGTARAVDRGFAVENRYDPLEGYVYV